MSDGTKGIFAFILSAFAKMNSVGLAELITWVLGVVSACFVIWFYYNSAMLTRLKIKKMLRGEDGEA